MHGRKDTIVDIEHAYRLKLLLEKHNLPFEWQEFPEGEHQFKEPAEAKETYRLMLDFINNNI